MSGALTTNFLLMPVNGGLVTSRDKSDLGQGGMQLTDNAVYRPGSQALWPIGARERFATKLTSGVWMVTPILDKDNTHLDNGYRFAMLLVRDGTAFRVWYSEWEEWEKISSTVIDPNDASLGRWARGLVVADPIFYPDNFSRYDGSNRHGSWFIGNGVNEPFTLNTLNVAGSSSQIYETRTHGMYPMHENPFSSGTAMGASNYFWIGPGHYFYWLTEYDSVRGTESMATSTYHIEVTIPVNYKVRLILTRGEDPEAHSYHKQNAKADYLRLYRAPSTDGTQYGNPFPANGERVEVTWYILDSGTTTGTGYDIPLQDNNYTMYLDDLGTPGSLAKAYGNITISVEGAVSVAHRDGKPPKWTFGDVFQESLVVNDDSINTRIVYSYPGKAHSFPITPDGEYLNWVEMSRGNNDWVTAIKSLDDTILIVGTHERVYRLNYLPRASDPVYRRDRLANTIADDHGVVGPRAITGFTLNGAAPRAAYVGQTGIYMTDGFTSVELTGDLDWDSAVDKEKLPQSVLVNYEDLASLVFFHNNNAWFLSYAPDHLKGGGLKISGPCSLNATSAVFNKATGEVITGGSDGYVYAEDSPTHQGANKVLVSQEGMHLKTGIEHPAGLHNEVTVGNVRVLTEEGERAEWTNQVTAPTVLKILKRDANQPDQPYEVAKEVGVGQLWKGTLSVVSEGIGAEYTGFSPFHWIGFEYTKQRGR